MQRFLLLSAVCVGLISSASFADHLYLFVNTGSGDNFGYISEMNGHPLILSGGSDFFFFGNIGYMPGSTMGGGAGLYLYDSALWINGVATDFSFPSATIFMTSFTLPTTGKDFHVPVDISFFASGIDYLSGQTIDLSGGASGFIDFTYAPDGLYHPGDFVEAPEPASLGMVAIRLVGILGATRRRLRV